MTFVEMYVWMSIASFAILSISNWLYHDVMTLGDFAMEATLTILPIFQTLLFIACLADLLRFIISRTSFGKQRM